MGGQGSGGHTRTREQMDLADDREPYERQPKETDPAWKSFTQYRDMENRTLAKVATALGKSNHLIERWSSFWRWRERTTAWDRARDDQARAATLAEIEEMQRRHIKLALGMQQLGAHELQRVLKAAQEKAAAGEAGGVGLSASDIHRLIDAGSKLERLNRGEPEAIERHEHTGGDGGPISVKTEVVFVKPDPDQS
jgi:hypothetical protein